MSKAASVCPSRCCKGVVTAEWLALYLIGGVIYEVR